MSKKLIATLGITTIALSGLALGKVYNADTVNAESNRHVFYVNEKSGQVSLDQKGNVIEASSPELLDNNQTVSTQTTVNNAYGRWVYFADGLINRTGNSNFYSTLGPHFSWVAMGSKAKTYGYGPNKAYSYASQTGTGTFQAGYGLY